MMLDCTSCFKKNAHPYMNGYKSDNVDILRGSSKLNRGSHSLSAKLPIWQQSRLLPNHNVTAGLPIPRPSVNDRYWQTQKSFFYNHDYDSRITTRGAYRGNSIQLRPRISNHGVLSFSENSFDSFGLVSESVEDPDSSKSSTRRIRAIIQQFMRAIYRTSSELGRDLESGTSGLFAFPCYLAQFEST